MRSTDARRLTPKAQELLRSRVVDAINGGVGKAEAARTFNVSRQSIHNWLTAVARDGADALQSQPRGPQPGPRLLTRVQANDLRRQIINRCPDQLLLPFALWTREAVCALATQRHGATLSVWTAGRYLKSWGMTPQKPVRRAYERNPVAVKRWLKEEYPEIVASAKREGAEIFWGDEMGLRSDHQTGTSYSLRGVTPVIPGTGQRFRCNMISAVTNRGRLSFMVFKEQFAIGVFIRFLKRLVKHVGRKVFLIVDRLRVHTSPKIKAWIDRTSAAIEIFTLPADSPDLNPDEFLNQDVKSNALGRRRPSTQAELIRDARAYLRSTQQRPDVVARYFHAPSVRYAA